MHPQGTDPTELKRITVKPWRQFGPLEIALDQRLTIITGSNGTGKTTLLSLIGTHFNWPLQLIGSPILDEVGHLTYKVGSDIPASFDTQKFPGMIPARYPTAEKVPDASEIAQLEYLNDKHCRLLVVENPSVPQLNVLYEDAQRVDGLFLNSHRSISPYQRPEWIPAQFSPVQQILDGYIGEIRSKYFSYGAPNGKSTMLLMKESLLAAAIYGEGNSSVLPDDEARYVWEGFQDVLRNLLPPTIGFVRLRAAPPEVILITHTGDYTIDALSGGLRAIFEMAWQIFLRARTVEKFTVCLDEPENHLHPELQRSIIPRMLRAFPSVRFIVATHSPFIVRASEEAAVYGLTFGEDDRVTANLFDLSENGLTPDDTLRDVLGLDNVMPIWAESKLNEIVARFTQGPPTPETITDLKDALVSSGLASEMPQAIETLVDQIDDSRRP
jgi:hypothetical protein